MLPTRPILALAFVLAAACVEYDSATDPELSDETQAVETPFKIYVSPTGNDSYLGLTPGSAVKSLQRVNTILDENLHFDEDTYSGPDIEVRIAPGTYYGQTVVWTAINPLHSITFMSDNADNVRPTFNGQTTPGQTSSSNYFFSIRRAGPTNLHFRFLRIENYNNGMSFRGETWASNESNSVYGCHFSRIGTLYTTFADGAFGAVNLRSTDFNRVENSYFYNIENKSADTSVHALYISNGSDENYVANNKFWKTSGVALKLRNDNWWNVFEYNSFSADGPVPNTAGYFDHPEAGEASSCQSVFRYNLLDGTYLCNASLPTFRTDPSPLDAVDGDTCNDQINPSTGAPYRRLSTKGNYGDSVRCNLQ